MWRIIIILAVLTACSPQIRIYSDRDPQYDLSAHRTFDWGQKLNIEQGKNPLYYNELNDQRIKEAVLEQMSIRGYSINTENPDLIFHYHIIVDDQSVVATDPLGYQYGPYWTNMQTNIYSYREGTLILDLMDKTTNGLIWRGWAVSAIDEIDPKKVDGLMKKTIARIFKLFPKDQKRNQLPENLE